MRHGETQSGSAAARALQEARQRRIKGPRRGRTTTADPARAVPRHGGQKKALQNVNKTHLVASRPGTLHARLVDVRPGGHDSSRGSHSHTNTVWEPGSRGDSPALTEHLRKIRHSGPRKDLPTRSPRGMSASASSGPLGSSSGISGGTGHRPTGGNATEPVKNPASVPAAADSKAGAAAGSTRGTKRRWARLQAPESGRRKMQRAEGSNDYNIWYHKYLGEAGEGRYREKAATRCRPRLDSGLTVGDASGNRFLCLHFAMGNCSHGSDCKYLHRLPDPKDFNHYSLMHDVFGRERHRTHRDDMGGIGSFDMNTRTLFVVGMSVMDSPQADEILARHFAEWGPIEEISVKRKHGCAFIRYANRHFAEFAKVAMADQSLDHGEQITVKWAHEDPNPRAQVREQVRLEDMLHNRLTKLGYTPQSDDKQLPPVSAQPQATQTQAAQHTAPAIVPVDNAQMALPAVNVASKSLPDGVAGPVGPQEAAAHRQIQAQQQYYQQQQSAMSSFSSVLDSVDRNLGNPSSAAASKVAAPKGSVSSQVDAFLASISSLENAPAAQTPQ